VKLAGPRRLRARRDQRPDQRDAAGRRLERALTVRHASGTDRVEARLPAADRRIMRLHPRKEAGIVVDFVHKSATHNDRAISLHSLLDADFYREGARDARTATPSPALARRRLTPAPWPFRHARRRTAPRSHPAGMAADRPEVPGRGRAAGARSQAA
jgi:hypothetical protein